MNFKALSKDLHSCLHASKLPHQRSKTGGSFAKIKRYSKHKRQFNFLLRKWHIFTPVLQQVPCIKIDEMVYRLFLVEPETA